MGQYLHHKNKEINIKENEKKNKKKIINKCLLIEESLAYLHELNSVSHTQLCKQINSNSLTQIKS